MVVVAQLVRALDCGSRGRRFETGLPPKQRGLSQDPFLKYLIKNEKFFKNPWYYNDYSWYLYFHYSNS